MDTHLTGFVEEFSKPDFIMEPTVYNQLKLYLQAGGSAELVVDLLSTSYQAISQSINIIHLWMQAFGTESSKINEVIEDHLCELIESNFDPVQADSIFRDAQQIPGWIAETIEFPCWRRMFCRLAEKYPDCLILNFIIKLISDAGYQTEITSVSTACQQMEVFSRMLSSLLQRYLQSESEQNMHSLMSEIIRLLCHSEHSYVYGMLLLNSVLASAENKRSIGVCSLKHLCHHVEKAALEQSKDILDITFCLLAHDTDDSRALLAVKSMLNKKSLNPADIRLLDGLYMPIPIATKSKATSGSAVGTSSLSNTPSLSLIRHPLFIELLIDSIFLPTAKINPQYRASYVHLLACACSSGGGSGAIEPTKKGTAPKRMPKDDPELRATINALEKATRFLGLSVAPSTTSDIPTGPIKPHELLHDLPQLLQCLKYPVVAAGVLSYLQSVLINPDDPQLYLGVVAGSSRSKVYMVLFDEIATLHSLLMSRLFSVLQRLFELPLTDLDDLSRLAFRKIILDRMVHLFSRGQDEFALQVTAYILQRWTCKDVDNSLFRYFVAEVLDIISAPYSKQFAEAFHPLVSNLEIINGLRDTASTEIIETLDDYLIYCHKHFNYDI